MKKLWLILVCLFLTQISFADEETMHDAFAQGFTAAKNQDKAEALKWFEQAGQEALRDQHWQGVIDAGNAFLHLDEPSKGAAYFQQAENIVKSSKDWRSLIAVGYAYASLPTTLPQKNQATNIFQQAGIAAESNNDWIGLTEAVNALIHIQQKQAALGLLENAEKIVRASESEKGAQVVAKLWIKLGNKAKASALLDLKQNSYAYQGSSNGVAPPPGWNPVGDSVAGPPQIDIETQKASRASADVDIAAKNEWILQQREIEAEKERLANEYSSYYYYPYGYNYSAYRPWGWDTITSWASHYSSQYTYTGGHYVYSHGSYTGFGFSYGYSEHHGGDHVSFGFGIYSD